MKKALQLIKIIRIIAAILIIVAIILYFTAKEYALYTAIAGFAIIALVNIPLNLWITFQNGKIRKEETEENDSRQKNNKT